MNRNLSINKSEVSVFFELVKASVNNLYKFDNYIIKERMEIACSARVMLYLQTILLNDEYYSVYNDYNVDLEYRKYKSETKTTQDNPNGIRPDLLVHKRGQDDNLIVVEFKMDSKSLNHDILKLRELTSTDNKYRYRLGILCIINVKTPKYLCFIGGEYFEHIV